MTRRTETPAGWLGRSANNSACAKSTAVNGTNASLTPTAPADLRGLSPVPADQFSMQGQPAVGVGVGARCSPGDRVHLYEWKAVVPRAATPRHDQQRLNGKRSSSGTRLRPIGSGCDDQRFRWFRWGVDQTWTSNCIRCRRRRLFSSWRTVRLLGPDDSVAVVPPSAGRL
jgi:hypothetical protein